jgi:hypothetical protein
MPGGRSSLNFICSHVLMEKFRFYEMTKKGGNKKKECCLRKGRGSSSTRVFSRDSATPSSGPFLGRMHLYGNLACNVNARFHLPYCVQPILVLHLDMLVCFCDTTQDSLNFFGTSSFFCGST